MKKKIDGLLEMQSNIVRCVELSKDVGEYHLIALFVGIKNQLEQKIAENR